MKLWVTGMKGLVGSALLRHAHPHAFGTGSEVDIADRAAVLSVFEREKPTHIINAAAYTAVDQAERQRELALRTNRDGPRALAELAARFSLPFLHISTEYVFDGKKGAPYVEDDACSPLSLYGLSKWEGEKAVMEAHPRACIVRTSWVFGRGGKNLLSQLPALLMRERELSVAHDQLSRPTYVDDLVQALIDLLPHSGIFHFANSEGATRLDVAHELLKRFSNATCQKINTQTMESMKLPAQRPLISELATDKFEALLGRKPRSWRATLEDFLKP